MKNILVKTMLTTMLACTVANVAPVVGHGEGFNTKKENMLLNSDITQKLKEYTKNQKFENGYTQERVNVRENNSTDSRVLDVYDINKKVSYTEYDSKWYKIKYKDNYAFIYKKYINKKKKIEKYKMYSAPYNTGFKAYMDWECITLKNSKQYKLQHLSAYTGNYGIRMVFNRYCAAIGTGFGIEVGDYVDLILENGAVIPIIISDIKADKDTDITNKYTEHDGSVVEFVVNTSNIPTSVKRSGDISYANNSWCSSIKWVKVYKKNYFAK